MNFKNLEYIFLQCGSVIPSNGIHSICVQIFVLLCKISIFIVVYNWFIVVLFCACWRMISLWVLFHRTIYQFVHLYNLYMPCHTIWWYQKKRNWFLHNLSFWPIKVFLYSKVKGFLHENKSHFFFSFRLLSDDDQYTIRKKRKE